MAPLEFRIKSWCRSRAPKRGPSGKDRIKALQQTGPAYDGYASHAGLSLVIRRGSLVLGESGDMENTACIALMILALGLTGLGLFGITDYLISMPGWEEAKKAVPQGMPPHGTVARAYKDYVDSLGRSRNIGFIFSFLSLLGGLGLGFWVSRTYIRHRSRAGVRSGLGGRNSASAVCNICGVKLSRGEEVRGACDYCRSRTG
jgi:hypothetical protein